MSVILLNQAIIHYESLGRGRPVVFLHSWVGSWHYWLASMQVASSTYRAYALDLYGYGETTHDPLLYSLGHQTDLVRGFMNEMGIGKAAIVGHGLGALVAFSLAASHPDRVARILAVGAPLDSAALRSQLRQLTSPELLSWLSGRASQTWDSLAEASRADPLVAAVALAGVGTDGYRLPVGERDVPLLLVYGQDDPSIHPPAPDDALLSDPNVHQVVLEEAGHFPMLDADDRFHRLLMDFLALEPGMSPRQLQPREEWRRRMR